jgi:hypothetical protein
MYVVEIPQETKLLICTFLFLYQITLTPLYPAGAFGFLRIDVQVRD